MKVVTVIPLSKKVKKEQLTYFTQKPVFIGDVVNMPVRKQTVKGLVVDIENADVRKSEIKNANFSLKKITDVIGPSGVPLYFIRACVRAKDYFITTTGTMIDLFLPDALLDLYGKNPLASKTRHSPLAGGENTNAISEKLAYQAPLEERISYYRTLVRTAFAKKESVYLCLPSHRDILFFEKVLGKGVEQHVFAFSGDEKESVVVKKIKEALAHKHPVLFIATGSYLAFSRTDLSTYIVEKENKEVYRGIGRPHVDARVMAEIVAEERHAKFIIADTILRIETYARLAERELSEAAPISFRFSKQFKELWILGDDEGALAKETIEVITRANARGKRTFVLAARKGIAGVTLCRDCGRIVHCPDCGKSLSLFEKQIDEKIKRLFICTHCGTTKMAQVLCDGCGSWNLYAIAIGSEQVAHEIRERVGASSVFVLDKEHAKSHTEAKRITREFYKTEGAVLVGTEMALYYLSEMVQVSIISSLETLLLIPSHSITDKIISLYMSVGELTKETVVIQTRRARDTLLKGLEQGNLLDTVKEELAVRKMLGYPPATEIIKITASGTKEYLHEIQEVLAEQFENYSPQFLHNPVRKGPDRFLMHMILKLPRASWSITQSPKQTISDTTLLQLLRSLSPEFDIHVHPESLL